MRLFKLKLLAAFAVVLAAQAVRAEVKPHPLFTDNAVLQRGVAPLVYGTADPGEAISFGFSGPNGYATSSKQPIVAGPDGKWSFSLPADLKPGTGYTLTIGGGKKETTLKNLAVGDVWICSGQSNMSMPNSGCVDLEKVKAASKNPKLRLFTVNRKATPEPLSEAKNLEHFTKWVEAGPDTVPAFTAVGYHFGEYLQKHLPGDVPVGLIHTSWGGTPAQAWTSKEALNGVPSLKYYHDNLPNAIKAYDPAKAEAAFQDAKKKWDADVAKAKAAGKKPPTAPRLQIDPKVSQSSPSTLYNAMIAPLLDYDVRGAIWYQGEANASKAFEYRTLLPTLITDWRARFKNHELPFFVVQLAPFMAINPEPQESAWAELREAQYMATTKLPKVGLAVITDVGEENDIHPKRKKPVGERLAIAALATEYGEKVEPSGPVYKAMSVEGDRAVLTFTHAGTGLECKGEKLTGFTIAGEDKKFYNADAEIKGDTVVVSSSKVSKPVAVRYGWANFPVVNFWSKDGLPAVPFRTDDFPMITAPAKK
jgi:sialate O-acetylesterase